MLLVIRCDIYLVLKNCEVMDRVCVGRVTCVLECKSDSDTY